MPAKKSEKSAAEECCAKCTSDIAALRKEVNALKKALASANKGSKDPRVSKLIEVLVPTFPVVIGNKLKELLK